MCIKTKSSIVETIKFIDLYRVLLSWTAITLLKLILSTGVMYSPCLGYIHVWHGLEYHSSIQFQEITLYLNLVQKQSHEITIMCTWKPIYNIRMLHLVSQCHTWSYFIPVDSRWLDLIVQKFILLLYSMTMFYSTSLIYISRNHQINYTNMYRLLVSVSIYQPEVIQSRTCWWQIRQLIAA